MTEHIGVATPQEDDPYFVEVDQNGCAHCSAGRTYGIIGPGGVALGQTWDDEEPAQELAGHLNAAFDAGRQSVSAVAKPDPVADLCAHIKESIRLCNHGYIHMTCGDCQRRD